MMTLRKVTFSSDGLEFAFELTNPKDLHMQGESDFFWKFEGLYKDGMDVEEEFYSFSNDSEHPKLIEFALYLYDWSKDHLYRDVNKLEKALQEEVKKWKF